MTQYAVVVRPDLTMNVRLMGPYRSRSIAEAVQRRFVEADDQGVIRDVDGNEVSILPEVVVLESWWDVLADVAPADVEIRRQQGCDDA